MLFYSKIITVVISNILMGIFFVLIYNGNNLYLSVKFENGINYSKYLHTARQFFFVFYVLLGDYIMNSKDLPTGETESGFKILSPLISNNFFDYMMIYHIISFISIIFVAF